MDPVAEWQTDDRSEVAKLRARVATLTATIAAAHGQIRVLQATISNQARALMELTEDVPPWAPSLAIVYWLYGPTRWRTKSWLTEQNRLKPLIRLLGDLKAAKLTPAAWAQYIAQRRLEPHRRGHAPADFLLNLELGRAKQMLAWAVSNGLLKFNPLASAKNLKARSRRETWIPLEEVDKLLSFADDVVDKRLCDGDDDGLRAKVLRAYVLCLHDPMLRPGEAMTVLLHPRRVGRDGRVELWSAETKGEKRRTVYLTPRTFQAVAPLAAVEEMPQRATVSRWFRALCDLAGVDALVAPGEKRLRAHDLRASGATTADQNGVSATAIRDTLGHAQLSTTEVYLRSTQETGARATWEKMTELTGGTTRVGPKRAASRKSLKKDLTARA